MSKRFLPVNEEWNNFLVCILLHMLLPLLPLLFEKIAKGSIAPSTYAISASMYALGIGLSSRNMAQFGLGILVGLFFSGVFGISTAQNPVSSWVTTSSVISMVAISVLHIIERYNRHIADCVPFFEFSREGAKA